MLNFFSPPIWSSTASLCATPSTLLQSCKPSRSWIISSRAPSFACVPHPKSNPRPPGSHFDVHVGFKRLCPSVKNIRKKTTCLAECVIFAFGHPTASISRRVVLFRVVMTVSNNVSFNINSILP